MYQQLFADVGIRTKDDWSQKRVLYQLSHNHCHIHFKLFKAAGAPLAKKKKELSRNRLLSCLHEQRLIGCIVYLVKVSRSFDHWSL